MAVDQILSSYSPESVVIVIGNNNFSHTINGYADGTFISMARTVPHATLYTGADGSNARVVRAVRNYDITLTLHQASESNDVLSQLLIRDEDSRNGDDVFYITIKDTSGRTVASSPSAFIGTTPDVSFGTELTEVAWVIHAIGMDFYSGGNGRFTGATWDTMVDLGRTPDEAWNPLAPTPGL